MEPRLFAKAALGNGIGAIVLTLFFGPLIGAAFGTLAILFAIGGLQKIPEGEAGRGKCIAGVVLGIISIAWLVATLLAL